jgi:hypothetical protein
MHDGDIPRIMHGASTREQKHRLTRVTAGVCGFCLLGSAAASPPMGQEGSSLSIKDLVRSMSVASRSVVRQDHVTNAHLDLRAPRESASKIIPGNLNAAFTPFPSAARQLDAGKANAAMDDRVRPTALGFGELNFQVMGQAEILARRIHRDGLPIARLMETKSALLSLGLNPRGKPGLWLTQKTH